MQPYGVMFHHFHDENHPKGQGSISALDLEEVIRFIGRERILGAQEWLQGANSGTLWDDQICLTFDDNLRCQYDIAYPVLKRHDITAFWFVWTSGLQGETARLEVYRYFRTVFFATVEAFYEEFFARIDRTPYAVEVSQKLQSFSPDRYLVDFPFYTIPDRIFRFVRDDVLGEKRYYEIMDRMVSAAGIDTAELSRELLMDDDCIRQLQADGHVIGLHSHSHPTTMTRLDYETQRREYTLNFEYLSTLLGVEPFCASHPCNSYNLDSLCILRDLGITVGFRADMTPMARTKLEYPREDHANIMSLLRSRKNESHGLHK